MKNDASFRRAVAEIGPSVRQLSDRDLRAFIVACLAELARRDGTTETAAWTQAQADRLTALDGATAA